MGVDFLLTPPPRPAKPEGSYKAPPIDGYLTVSEIYDWHYQNNPHHPVFVYANHDGQKTWLFFSDVVPAIHKAARYVAEVSDVDLENDGKRPLIAIIAATDTITFSTTLLGMLRAEFPVMPISPRNSPAAVAHLLSELRPTHILVSVDHAIRQLVQDSLVELKDPDYRPKVCSMPEYRNLYIKDDNFIPLRPRGRDVYVPRIIVHSSGSSSFPKPIPWTDRSYLQTALVTLFGAHDLRDEVLGCHSVAMFHAVGINILAWLSTAGFVIATFAPASPATTPTPEATYTGFIDTPCSYVFGVPSFIEEWSRDPIKVSYFKNLKGVAYGGGPLNKHAGDLLAEQGVSVYTFYGASEVGVIGTIVGERPGLDWEYFTLNQHCAAELVPIGDGTYELLVVAKPTQSCPFVNTKFRGQDAYATNDLLVPHPTKHGYFRVVGRKDDTIMLSTGEKTNPGPLEFILRKHHKVRSAMFFGRGRFQNGVLVELKKEYAFDPKDSDKLIEFRNDIWPTVEEMNAFAPQHSRVFKEMIIVADPFKPFTYTPKGAPKRAVITKDYESEIDAVYAAVEETTQIVNPPVDWSSENSLAFVRTVVNSVLKRPAADQDDIFEGGCDSLQATWIRNAILHALRSTEGVSTIGVSTNFVYEHPTILSLVSYASSVVHSGSGDLNISRTTAKDIDAFVTRYTRSFPRHVPASSADVVLVTGTTGSLGTAVFAKLVVSESVRIVYALNRRSKNAVGVLERQKNALKTRGYDPALASSPKVVLLEGDLSGTGLGLDHALEDQIRKEITHIMHIAWPVNFNMSLPSFETSIGGIRTLVDLALSSPHPIPPRLLFTSSVGVFRNVADLHTPVFEAPIKDSTISLGQGYGESKYVSEKILESAAKNTPLRPIAVRVGQICGGPSGAWNSSDWVPAIVKSSITLGCLPEIRGKSSWIPLDLAAEALVEIRDAQYPTVHLIHPRPVPCKDIFGVMSQELGLPLRPYAEWVNLLEQAVAATDATMAGRSSKLSTELEKIPAGKILQLFKGGLKTEEEIVASNDETLEVMGIPKLAIDNALASSTALSNAASLGSLDVVRWLGYWRKIGFLTARSEA